MTDELRAERKSQGLKTFQDVIKEHAEQEHVIVGVVFVTPESMIEIELDANAQEIIPDIVARLQAVSRALAN